MESFIEFLLFASIASFSLLFLQIKTSLRRRGYDVRYFLGWGEDYYRFSKVIRIETNNSEKKRLKNILLGLSASMIGMTLPPILGILSG